MPRFHFHSRSGSHHHDETGWELDSVDEAHVEAVRLLGNILIDESEAFSGSNEAWEVSVTDHAGQSVFRLSVSGAKRSR